jgi:hypothetical protein
MVCAVPRNGQLRIDKQAVSTSVVIRENAVVDIFADGFT